MIVRNSFTSPIRAAAQSVLRIHVYFQNSDFHKKIFSSALIIYILHLHCICSPLKGTIKLPFFFCAIYCYYLLPFLVSIVWTSEKEERNKFNEHKKNINGKNSAQPKRVGSLPHRVYRVQQQTTAEPAKQSKSVCALVRRTNGAVRESHKIPSSKELWILICTACSEPLNIYLLICIW